MTASRSLLELAAKYRGEYLQRFFQLGKANLTEQKEEPVAFIIPAGQPNAETVSRLLEILMWQGIEVNLMTNELYIRHDKTNAAFHEVPLGSFLIYVNQPQKNNVLSLFEKQEYPHRVNAKGEPDVPYDVAGWTLPLQMGVETMEAWGIKDDARSSLKPMRSNNDVRPVLNLKPVNEPFAKLSNPLRTGPKIGIYAPSASSIDEGWTRLVFDNYQIAYTSVSDKDIRENKLDADVLVLPSIGARTMITGLSEKRYPAEFAGGIGDAGVENLKKYVENGGRLICFDDSCSIVIEKFGLPMVNVLAKLKRSEFYNPGSIVKLDVNTKSPLAKGLPSETAAYFISSSAFEIKGDKVRSVAKYASSNALLSGWMLGEKYLNGKTALAEADYGKGKIILFAFRPQHRGQTFATFPFIFNALEK